jgi:hypothetical protein
VPLANDEEGWATLRLRRSRRVGYPRVAAFETMTKRSRGVRNGPVKSLDLMDRLVQDVENSAGPKEERDFIIGRIRSVQNAIHNNSERGGFQGPIRGATQLTTAAMVGNPISSSHAAKSLPRRLRLGSFREFPP